MFGGLVVPAITPMTSTGDVDAIGIGLLVEHLVEGGVDGLFVFGTSGEGPSLTVEQRRVAAQAFVRATGRRVPILAGVAGNSVAQCRQSITDMTEAGVDGIVLMPPLYLAGMGEELVEQHLRTLAMSTEMPVVLYNIPQHTQNPITPRMLARLGQLPNVVAIKDSSAEDRAFLELLAAGQGAGIAVFQGAESMIASGLQAGADGVVPGIGNVIPRVIRDLVSAADRADWSEVERLQDVVDRVCEVLSVTYWLVGLKYAVSRAVGCSPALALGIRPATGEEAAVIELILDGVGATTFRASPRDEEVSR